MGQDRFVHFSDRKPTWEEVRNVTEDYLGSALLSVEVQDAPENGKLGVLVVTIAGTQSHPLKRIAGVSEGLAAFMAEPPEPGFEARYLEVWLHPDLVNVETRMQDEFTNRVADGLAGVFARFWQGKLETG